MMLDLVDLASGGQQVVEVAPPPGGVLARAMAVHPRPIQYGFDPAADAASRLVLLGPDRLQDLHHQASVDVVDRQLADDRRSVGVESVAPLLAVLGVPPACFMGSHVRRSAPVKRYRLRLGGLL